MSAQYYSKHGIVSKPQSELYMAFTDLRNIVEMVPEDKRQSVSASFDELQVTVQGFTVGVRVTNRNPYDRIVIEDSNAPFHFMVVLHFDAAAGGKTDFSIEIDADLNLMMKMMLGKKLQEGIDKIVDSLVAISEGRMPEGVDPSMFPGGKMPF